MTTMNPVQQHPGRAVLTAAQRIAFVRSCFRPRPQFWSVPTDAVAASKPRLTLPGNRKPRCSGRVQ
jgi:hypothetical protein